MGKAMPQPPADSTRLSLRAAVALAGVGAHQLWWDCLLLCGNDTVSPNQVIDAVYGAPTPRSTFNLIATAVNDRLLDLGLAPLVTLKPLG
jgi:hypothetical protein